MRRKVDNGTFAALPKPRTKTADVSTSGRSYGFNRTTRSSVDSDIVVRSCAVVVLILLCLNLFMTLQHKEDNKFTFTRLLEIFANVPDLKLEDWRLSPIIDNWPSFNWFRDFLNSFVPLINTIAFLIGGIATIVTFVGYFLSFLFF